MKTVRLDAPLEAHCDRLFGQRLDKHLAGFIGTVEGDPDFPYSAAESEEAFAQIMDEKYDRIMGRNSSKTPGEKS